jgi:putative spermidine/putrescine transport system substrate-binding protein
MMMWQGDPFINRYMADYIVPALKQQYDITLQIVPGQGTHIVSTLLAELEAGKQESSIDMCWLNGETFFQLRQIDALHGPFVDLLPNNKYIDWQNPFIYMDFQQRVEGYECPWGNVQMALIYDSAKVSIQPQFPTDLEAWVQIHPGKFTISNDFTGMTFLKAMLSHFAGGKTALGGDFDAAKYKAASAELWTYLNRIKKNFWNGGSSFPADVAQMHQLFAAGEIWFTMSNNDAEVDNKIAQGLFPATARAYVPAMGTIQNSHYLAITKNSARKAAAFVVINHMISPEAQLHKFDPAVWGDGTVLAMDNLPADFQQRFAAVPTRKYAPQRSSIQASAIQEPAPEYMIHLFEDFRKEVIEQ